MAEEEKGERGACKWKKEVKEPECRASETFSGVVPILEDMRLTTASPGPVPSVEVSRAQVHPSSLLAKAALLISSLG